MGWPISFSKTAVLIWCSLSLSVACWPFWPSHPQPADPRSADPQSGHEGGDWRFHPGERLGGGLLNTHTHTHSSGLQQSFLTPNRVLSCMFMHFNQWRFAVEHLPRRSHLTLFLARCPSNSFCCPSLSYRIILQVLFRHFLSIWNMFPAPYDAVTSSLNVKKQHYWWHITNNHSWQRKLCMRALRRLACVFVF